MATPTTGGVCPKTPFKKVASALSGLNSTPRSHHTHVTENVPLERPKVMMAMRSEIVECDWKTFCDNYCPFVPQERAVNEGIELLHSRRYILQSGQWGAKLDVKQRDENIYFKVFVEMSRILEDVEVEGRKKRFRLIHRPHNVAAAGIPGGSHMMDGCFYLIEDSEADGDLGPTFEYSMANIGNTAEYKLKDEWDEVYANRGQLTSSAHFALAEDPRRMWMYGFTVEGDHIRLWYFSRSHSAVSKSLNWRKHPKAFISFLITFIFATPQELGFDPNVRRCFPSTETEYLVFRIIDVGVKPAENLVKEGADDDAITDAMDTAMGDATNDSATDVGRRARFFMTKGSLSEYRPHRLTGRATRVWRVIEVESFEGDTHTPKPGAREMALKDVWLDASAKTEKQIHDELFEDIRGFIQQHAELPDSIPLEVKTVLQEGTYQKHFLTIDCDARGFTTRRLPPSAKPCPEIFDKPQKALRGAQNSHPDTSRTHTHPQTEEESKPEPKPVNPPRDYAPKRQYRVVFDEVCEAMHHLKTFKNSMSVLQDGLIGLIIMHLAGWLHRDISGGNILWYTPTDSFPRGILSDLEYAKKASEMKCCSDPKTGTRYYMAIEILNLKRMAPIDNQEDDDSDDDSDDESVEDFAAYDVEEASKDQSVRPNFLHDLESVWWLHLHTMLRYSTSEEATTFVRKVFTTQETPPLARVEAFQLKNDLSGNLHKIFKEHPLRHLIRPCEKSRKLLLKKHLNHDTQSIQPLGDSTTNRLLKLCKRSVDLADKPPGIPDIGDKPHDGQQNQPQAPPTSVRAEGSGSGSLKRSRASVDPQEDDSTRSSRPLGRTKSKSKKAAAPPSGLRNVGPSPASSPSRSGPKTRSASRKTDGATISSFEQSTSRHQDGSAPTKVRRGTRSQGASD